MTTEKEETTTTSWLKEAQKGYIRMGVLILLNKKPFHGYEIMKEINTRTKGFWQPTAGGVYPVLRDLEKSGYIEGEWQIQKNRKIKVYKITESGELILRRAIIKEAEIFNNIGSLFQEFVRDVLNIETITSMPNMPSPFTPFLDETADGEENLEHLEHERKHTYESFKMMQERLKLIDKRIRKIKKLAHDDSPQAPS
jgi:DNA-binding PadR family transcriptional regulator